LNTKAFKLNALAAVLALALAGQASFAADVAAPLSARINASAMQENGSYDRFIITYRDGSTQRGDHVAATQAVSAAIGRAGLVTHATVGKAAVRTSTVNAVYQRKLAIGADLVRTSRKLSRTEAVSLMQQLAADPSVAHVEPDVMMRAIRDTRASALLAPAAFTPNDQYYGPYQWHLRAGDGTSEKIGGDTTSYANKGGADVAAAWDLADGTGVTVAVLDTGLTHHPDIDTSLGDAGYDFISSGFVSGRSTDDRAAGGWDTGDWTTGDEYLATNGGCVDASNPAEDSSWHGTHVSGTVAELTNNGTGMAGSAFNAKVLPVRVLGHCGGFNSDIADAIEWASGGHVDGVPDNQNPAQIINMSLGGGGSCSATDVLGQAIADANSRGTVVVVAAGNNNANVSGFSPASCPGAIAVGAIGISGKRAFYSNFGSGVAVASPGGGIYANDASSGTQVQAGFVWSAINDGTTVPDESGYTYGGYAGTSQATPHVTGTIALVISALQAASLPALSPADMRTLITSTARSFPSTPDQTLGAGIIDAAAAVNKALGNDGNPGGPGDGDATALTNGTAVAVSGNAGDTKLYKIDVPAGAHALVLRTFGGTGDVSLYVKNGDVPTTSSFDKSSVHVGNSESAVYAVPAAGTYYLLVSGVADFSNVSVQATFVSP